MKMKKPEIKINFLYYGSPFNFEKNFMVKLLKKKYKVILSNKPDYVFFSVYKNNNKFLLEDGNVRVSKESEKEKENLLKWLYRTLLKKDFVKGVVWFLRDRRILEPYAKILEVKGDFVKIFYSTESIKPDMSKCDWAFALCPESEISNSRYMRIPSYIMEGEEFYLREIKKSFNAIKKEKTKFCNFIYNNYIPPRNKFFKELNKYKHVDSPGKCMNNMPPIGAHISAHDQRNSKNWDAEKIEFIKPYKFTIAAENAIKDGYNTDRITHAHLANSIPIYLGDKTIGRDFNTKSFINGNGFENFEEVIKEVIKLDNDDKLYEEMLNQPWYNGKENPSEKEIKRIEKRFEEIFGK